jgi:hypothetical protein
VRGRRVLLVVILVMGLTAVAASLNPPQRRLRSDPTPSPTPPSAAPVDGSRTVAHTLDADAEAVTVRAHVGDIVQLEVTAAEPDTVAFEGQTEPVDPASPARFELYAGEAGEFPIRLVDGERLVGTVLVQP